MKIIPVALLYFLFSSSNASLKNGVKEKNADTAIFTDDVKDGWQLLFDGKTTNGWHTYGKSSANSRWSIADNTLYLDTSKQEGGDILTDEEFENFDLKLEWKISQNGNSGIIVNIKEDTEKYKETYKTGPEIQVLDNEGHPDGKILKHRAGDLYDLIKSSSEPVKPFGEWNAVEIISDKGKLQVFLNGTNVVTTTMWNDNWRALIAGSKFKAMPDFGTFKKGRIALQDHGNAVWYRNIMIKKL
jgi:Domain of Unknown Function (DUF1080)